MDELEDMMQCAGMVNDTFAQRDINFSFNASMMTQVNELDKDRHIKANFTEFLEAYARCCEKLSLGPILDGEEDDVILTEEEKVSQPLWKKIYHSLPIVYQNCMSNAFKEKWVWPKVDPKIGLFKDKYYKKTKKKTTNLHGFEPEENPPKDVVTSVFE